MALNRAISAFTKLRQRAIHRDIKMLHFTVEIMDIHRHRQWITATVITVQQQYTMRLPLDWIRLRALWQYTVTAANWERVPVKVRVDAGACLKAQCLRSILRSNGLSRKRTGSRRRGS